MNILVIGNGGREHALAWKLAQSTQVNKVYVAPGNPGTAQEAKCENVAIGATDVAALVTFAQANNIALTVVGPEAPLAAGIVDAFRVANLAIFGPTKIAAQLESSKAFAKDFMARHHIPTAFYQVFTGEQRAEALAYVREKGAPIVLKADGLAAGKGVIVAMTLAEAEAGVEDILGGKFGSAGARLVVEEFLAGEEASFIVMCDGKNALPMATSQDHKARDNGDKGPNTGGMGAYSPAPVVTNDVHNKIMERIINPVLLGMAEEGNPYTGFLYAGCMIDSDGNPKTLEFNCRFGDPETQPIMMRLQSDLVELVKAALACQLDTTTTQWDTRVAVGVVMAAANYPDEPKKGDIITGITKAEATGAKVFQAGTATDASGNIITNGGRVLCVTALGESTEQAQAAAYNALQQVQFEGAFYRTDIGYRAIEREKMRKT
ncbi:MAG: phosphoribosylamine--glycine ligase [Thiotrichales bacterium]|jgi:phosphoribosylamine--glycine ligase|nr:phosphoribosylamine--glycine ligase [Thiotrichales bacterium]